LIKNLDFDPDPEIPVKSDPEIPSKSDPEIIVSDPTHWACCGSEPTLLGSTSKFSCPFVSGAEKDLNKLGFGAFPDVKILFLGLKFSSLLNLKLLFMYFNTNLNF